MLVQMLKALSLDNLICIRTFEDGHVDVCADLRHMSEPSNGRLISAALFWLQVITAAPAGNKRDTRRRQQGHQGGEGQKEEAKTTG